MGERWERERRRGERERGEGEEERESRRGERGVRGERERGDGEGERAYLRPIGLISCPSVTANSIKNIPSEESFGGHFADRLNM